MKKDIKKYSIETSFGSAEFSFSGGDTKLSSKALIRDTVDINIVCDFKATIKEGDDGEKKESYLEASFGIVSPEAARKITAGKNGMVVFSPLHKCIIVSYYHAALAEDYIRKTLEDLSTTSNKESDPRRTFYALLHSMFRVRKITPLETSDDKTKVNNQPKTSRF